MKKMIIVVAIAIVVGGFVAFLAANTTDSISIESHTTELRFENPQTGRVEWIKLD